MLKRFAVGRIPSANEAVRRTVRGYCEPVPSVSIDELRQAYDQDYLINHFWGRDPAQRRTRA